MGPPFFSVCDWLSFLRVVALAKSMKEAFSCCRHINQPEFVFKKGGSLGGMGYEAGLIRQHYCRKDGAGGSLTALRLAMCKNTVLLLCLQATWTSEAGMSVYWLMEIVGFRHRKEQTKMKPWWGLGKQQE